MIRGTTPTLTLTLTLSNEIDFETYFVTFRQEGYTIVEKTEADCAREGTVITVPLTQDDTLRFRSGAAVEIQVRGKAGGKAFATSIKKLYADDILKEGKI